MALFSKLLIKACKKGDREGACDFSSLSFTSTTEKLFAKEWAWNRRGFV